MYLAAYHMHLKISLSVVSLHAGRPHAMCAYACTQSHTHTTHTHTHMHVGAL